ncbi:hypothetical protein DV706_21280 (plasmid) [Natronorubrum bangense]|uniref:Uncharacterized protein n=2 Tax=Natronorubrum bangense TaxID=61858 RepID=L9W1Q3_9EURY|nr:hypothetical protein C494_19757 [Natronorubrum bangense JCM 10635]QCC57052.1 hypothetical protein DV706_21280 [Natronorubrum bangense]
MSGTIRFRIVGTIQLVSITSDHTLLERDVSWVNSTDKLWDMFTELEDTVCYISFSTFQTVF